MDEIRIVQHPVMEQFVNLLQGICESKDAPAMVEAAQLAADILLSPAFQSPHSFTKPMRGQ